MISVYLLLDCSPNPITAISHLFRQVLCAQGAEPTVLSYLPLPPLFPPASSFHPLPSSIIRSKNYALQQKNKKRGKIPCQCKIN